jgi:hypothetical protein
VTVRETGCVAGTRPPQGAPVRRTRPASILQPERDYAEIGLWILLVPGRPRFRLDHEADARDASASLSSDGSRMTAMHEPARYQVRQIQRAVGPYGKTIWKITFHRVGAPSETLELTVHSAIFSGMDLDAEYTGEDLVRLREAGGG